MGEEDVGRGPVFFNIQTYLCAFYQDLLTTRTHSTIFHIERGNGGG